MVWQALAASGVSLLGKTCSVEGCNHQTLAKGLCSRHYQRARRHGDPEAGGEPRGVYKVCSIEGCGRPHRMKGLCARHCAIKRRHGSPEAGKRAENGFQKKWLESAKHYTGDECLYWPFNYGSNGYGDALGTNASRAMCITAHGPPPKGYPHALHSCGMGHLGCVNPRHLYWGSPKQNSEDAIAHGRIPRGSAHCCAKLTEADVLYIRQAKASGASLSQLAAQFGVHPGTIHDAATRKTWAWLK